jgi:tRNA nucleotidyltransferase (CCA-adding enzyme)
MEVRQDFSFGIVPVHKIDEKNYLFCVVKRTAGYWEFPKGHKEGTESDEEAAFREYLEEVGQGVVTIVSKETYHEQYSFVRDGVTIDKVSKYFVGLVDTMSTSVPECGVEEVQQIEWLPFEKVVEKLTFPGAKLIAQEVNKSLHGPEAIL